MTRIIAIRPEPGLSQTIRLAREMGLGIVGLPLFEIRPLAWNAPDPSEIDALLIGSANAIRHGGGNLKYFINKPIHVVGKATKLAVEAAGFKVASVGSGGLQSVLDTLAGPQRLLRIAGADHVPLHPPQGVNIHKVIAYESVALPLDPALFDQSKERAIVLLHSGIAAQHFANECRRLNIEPQNIEIAALAPRIASSAGKGWSAIHIAEHPDDTSLLAKVKALCQ